MIILFLIFAQVVLAKFWYLWVPTTIVGIILLAIGQKPWGIGLLVAELVALVGVVIYLISTAHWG